MKSFLKKIALLLLAKLERAVDFYTSPIPPIAERLKMIFNQYEAGTTRFMRKNIRNGVAFDIGANVGYYACLMSRYAEQVYAFEPDPDNYKILERNCKNRPNITPLNMAVSDKVGVSDFYKVRHSAMRHSLIDEGNTQKLSIMCTTLDAFVHERDITNVTMIKIDVEGAEPLVFAGMKELLASQHPTVIYEGDDPQAKAISQSGEIVRAVDAKWWGSRKKVTNLVW